MTTGQGVQSIALIKIMKKGEKYLLSVVFNWKMCAICGKSTGDAALQEFSTQSKQRTPVLNSSQSPNRASTAEKYCIISGWDDSWYDVATSAVIVRNHSTWKPIVSEIKLENVWGGHKKQGHVWGRHQKQDLLRVQWRWGSCRSAVSYSSHTVTSISSSQYLSGPLKTTGTSYDLDGKFSFTKVNTSPVQGCFKLSMNSSPRSWSLVSWAARWRVCYIYFIFYIKFYANIQ